METILAWPPILWVSRALVLLVLSGAFVLVSGLLIRLLRPANLRGLVAGDVPLRGLRGKLTLLGQEFEADVDLDSRRVEQLAALERRLGNLIDVVYEHGTAIEWMLVRGTEGGNGESE